MSSIKQITNEVVLRGRQGNQCWFAPSISVVPGRGESGLPLVHVGAFQLIGNDCGPQHWICSGDLGKKWSPPMESQNLLGIPRENDFFEKLIMKAFYHRHSARLLAIGSTTFVRDAGTHSDFKMESHDWKKECKLPNTMVFSEWDFDAGDFAPWKRLSMPEELERFHRKAWPTIQLEFDDGSLLIATYVIERPEDPFYAAIAVRVVIEDSGEMRLVEAGNMLRHDTKRGLCEPSITRFRDRYLMTIRHDDTAYVAVSADGLRYDKPVEWCFDDGKPLGNYNTQQHWLVHNDTLFLLYNRRHELNNGVFRGRAPLFIAEVDPDAMRVRKETEQIVFPEKGARMGNFDVLKVTENEAWVVTGEWLEQMVPGHQEGMRFHANGGRQFNRIQYIGDLLLARIML